MHETAAHVEIRQALLFDAPAIAAVLQEAFQEYEPLYLPDAYAATILSAEQIHVRIKQQEGPVWVAEQHGALVGTISAVPKENGLYIRSMAIAPGARNAGIGRALLMEAERFALENSCARMFLSTTPFLFPAIRMYERFGFTRTEEAPHDLHGTPLLTMEKPLPTHLS